MKIVIRPITPEQSPFRFSVKVEIGGGVEIGENARSLSEALVKAARFSGEYPDAELVFGEGEH